MDNFKKYTLSASLVLLSGSAFADGAVYTPDMYGTQEEQTVDTSNLGTDTQESDAYQSGQKLGQSINNASDATVGAVKDTGNAISNWWDGLSNTVKDPTDESDS